MTLPVMPNDASVAEILSEASKLKVKKDKVEFLSRYKNREDMEHIIKGAYHPAIEWLVPDGPLPEGVQLSDVPAVDLADDRLIRAFRQFRYLGKFVFSSVLALVLVFSELAVGHAITQAGH